MTVQRFDQRPNRSRWRTSGAGDAVLPGQHAGPLQRLQRLGHRAAAALRLGGDRLVAREAAAGAAVVEAPQQRLQDLQEGAGDRTLVLARLAVAGAPGASRRRQCGPWRCGPAGRHGRGRTPSRGGGSSWLHQRRQVQPIRVGHGPATRCRDRNPASTRRRSIAGRLSRLNPSAAMASRLRWHTSSDGNMTASSRAALRGSRRLRVGAVIGGDGSGDVVSATLVDGHSSGVPWLCRGRAGRSRARASPRQEIGSCETGLS